jgi:hypothetical protein
VLLPPVGEVLGRVCRIGDPCHTAAVLNEGVHTLEDALERAGDRRFLLVCVRVRIPVQLGHLFRFEVGRGFRSKSATRSGMKSAGVSDLKSATR